MKNTITLLLIFIGIFTYSQSKSYLGTIIGYKNVRHSNNLVMGISAFEASKGFISLNGSIDLNYITDFKNNHIGELGLNLAFVSVNGGLNISNKYIEPNLGLNFTYGKAAVGYAIDYTDRNYVTLDIHFTIPIIKL